MALSAAQIAQFIDDGFVPLEDAFPREVAAAGRRRRADPRPPRLASPHRAHPRARRRATATGPAGTVYLCHPFLVHAAQRHRGTQPRFMAQPPLYPARPYDVASGISPVEVAVRDALAGGQAGG
jgi:hypothetical protein